MIKKTHERDTRYDVSICCVDGKTDTYVNVKMEQIDGCVYILQTNGRTCMYPINNIIRMISGSHDWNTAYNGGDIMNENKFVKTIKKGGKTLFWWKLMNSEICSSRNEDGTYSAEGLYIPFNLRFTREMIGKLVGIIHSK